MAQNWRAPVMVRRQPDIFCFSLAIRMSRSVPLLSGGAREAIVLRYYADFSEAEVAAAMGISCGAVKSHTARAMAALRADLEHQDQARKP